MRRRITLAATTAIAALALASPASAGKANFQDISITSPGGEQQRACIVVTPGGDVHRVALQACDVTR